MGNTDSHGNWVPDDTVTACTKCKEEFTLTNRRHHCRTCGNIFCGACSQWTDAKGERVCEAHSQANARSGTGGSSSSGNKPNPVDPGLYQVRALHDFQEAEPGDLSIFTGEVITVLDDQDDPFWWRGRNASGKVGTFPSNYVERIK